MSSTEQEGDEDLSQDEWVGRFALRLAMHDRSRQHALERLLELGDEVWPAYKGMEPEVIADAKYRGGLRELASGSLV
jgi:hypothetical protein